MKRNIFCSAFLGLLFVCSPFIQASTFGWQSLADTKIKTQCPANNFGGHGYAFNFYCKNVTKAWSSGAFDTRRNRLYVWGGGHHDYYGNELYALDVATKQLLRLTDPAPPADPNAEPQSELFPNNGTQPNSRHTYDGFTYMENVDRVWAFSGSLASRSGTFDSVTWIYNPQNNQWMRDTPTGDLPDGAIGVLSAYDPVSGKIYLHNRKGFYSYTYTESGGHYELLNGQGYMGVDFTAEIDPVNRYFLIIGKGVQIRYELSAANGYKRHDDVLAGESGFISTNRAPGVAFNTTDSTMYSWVGDGKLYKLDANTLSWSSTAFINGPGSQFAQGTFGRFAYYPEQNSFVYIGDVTENAFQLKLSTEVDTVSPSKPTALTASQPYAQSILLEWQPSSDNFGIAGYSIYRNGQLIDVVTKNQYKSMGLTVGQEYQFEVEAFDSANNISERSAVKSIVIEGTAKLFNLGDCSSETLLSLREDIVFCEPWEDESWWDENGYYSEATVIAPRPMDANIVINTSLVEEGCVSGKCLKVNTPKNVSKSLSMFWPLKNANQAPENLYVRYYIKLGNDWNANMCDAQGNIVGSGGKFPGVGDMRTYKDPVGQCGNGGNPGDGENCWSHRSVFRGCDSADGQACSSKPNAVTRFGSYVYHSNQAGATGDAGYWDNDDWGQSQGSGATCATNPTNLYCGVSDNGVLETGIWYEVEMQIQMNTPGQSDGVIRGWVDGNLSYEKLNMEFRNEGHDFLHNRMVWLDIYKGGLYGNCQDAAIYLDQMVVAVEQPIGGMERQTVMPPEIMFSATSENIQSGDTVTLNWQSTNANYCNASGDWSGAKNVSGEETLQNVTESGDYLLECSGEGGTSLRQVSIVVNGDSGGGTTTPPPVTGNVSLPSNLNVSQLTSELVELSWQAAESDAGILGYKVYANEQWIGFTQDLLFQRPIAINGVSVEYAVEAIDKLGDTSGKTEALVVDIPFASQGSLLSLLPDSDTYSAASTFKNLSHLDGMDVSASRRAYMHFPLESLESSEPVTSAVLKIHSLQEFGDITLKVFAVASPWVEESLTRNYSDSFTNIEWQTLNGDWLDNNNVKNGQDAYAEQLLLDDNVANAVYLDITELVRKWQTGELVNYGLVLVTESKKTQRFASKEHSNEEYKPQLIINDYGVEQTQVEVLDDSFLNATTYKSLGELEWLELSPMSNILLRFDIQDSAKFVDVESVTLRLHTSVEAQNLNSVRVFKTLKPWIETQASRSFASTSPELRWENNLGDWVDSNGIEQGHLGFSTTSIVDDDVFDWVDIDITALFRHWQVSEDSNLELMLNSYSTGIFKFHSSEYSDPTLRPYLEIVAVQN